MWIERVRYRELGLVTLRYGLVILLGVIGAMKFFEFEAVAIERFIANHPLMSWMIPVFGLRGASALIGIAELAAATAIAVRPWAPRVSAYGSLAASGTFVVTLSFLVTTPQPPTGFLMKDLILLGAALYTAGEAFAAATRGTQRATTQAWVTAHFGGAR
jgi:uncharacterized membrane protein YkgB